MPDNFESRIGFEATDALRDLGALAKAIEVYTAALKANPRAAKQFNEANSFEQALEVQNKVLKETVTNLKALAAQETATARASQEAATQARRTAEARASAQRLERRQQANAVRAQILGRVQLPGADPRAVAALDAAIARIQKLVLVSGTSAKRVQAINNNLGKSYEGTGRRIRDALIQVEGAVARINRGTRNTRQSFGGLENQLGSTLTAFLRYRVVSGIFIAIERQIRESIETAKELELRLAEIQTISPEFRIRGLDSVQQQVQSISQSFGIDQLEVASGLYQTLSNQIGDANQSVQFLTDSAAFSRATLTDLSDSVNLLAGVLNAYGLEASNAARVSDVLFKTIELGRVRGQELAQNFGNITTQAAQLGVDIEEVGAAIATLTIQGVKADTAMTGLQNIFIKLIRPSSGLKKALDEIGVSSVRAGIETDGLIGFLIKLEQTTGGTIEELGEMFPRVRALRGEMGLVADEGNKAVETFNRLRKEFRGASADAAGIVLETQAAELERNLKTIENAFTSDIGRPLIRTINDIVEAVGGAEAATQVLIATIQTIGPVAISVIGLVAVQQVGRLALAIGRGTIAAKILSGTLSLLGGKLIGGSVLAATALAFAFSKSKDFVKELRVELEQLQNSTKERIREITQTQNQTIEANKAAIKENTDAIIIDLRKRQGAFRQNRDQAIRFQQQVTDSLKDQLQERLSLVDQLVNAVVKAQEAARKNIADLAKGQVEFEFEINQGRFERNLRAIESPARQARELVRRSNELISAAQRAPDTGFSQRLIEDAIRQAERAADISGQRRIGERQINRVLAARQALNRQLIEQEKAKAKFAAQQESAIREQAITLRRDIDTFNIKAKELTKGTEAGDFSEAEVSQRRKELESLGASIRSELDQIGKSGLDILLGQSQALRLLSDPFRDPLNGKQVELEFAIGESVDKLVTALKDQVAQTPIPIQLAIEEATGTELGIQGFTQVIDKIAKLSQTAQKAQDNSRELTAAQQQLAASNKAVELSADALVASFAQREKIGFSSLFDTGSFSFQNTRKINDSIAVIGTAFREIRSQIKNAIDSGDLEGLAAAEARLQRFITVTKETGEIGGPDFAQQNQIASELLGQIQTLTQAQAEFNKQRAAFAQGTQAASQLGLLRDALGDPAIVSQTNTALGTTQTTLINLGAAGSQTGQSLNTAFDTARRSQDALRASVEQTTAALRAQEAAGASGQSQNLARGGKVKYFDSGGFSPRGTDTVPAMLTPGETVINAQSSRRFFSELAAINAGKPPIFRQDGGAVSNNFTGDINLNVSAPNGVVNGREAAKEIRRELRRKTAKL